MAHQRSEVGRAKTSCRGLSRRTGSSVYVCLRVELTAGIVHRPAARDQKPSLEGSGSLRHLRASTHRGLPLSFPESRFQCEQGASEYTRVRSKPAGLPKCSHVHQSPLVSLRTCLQHLARAAVLADALLVVVSDARLTLVGGTRALALLRPPRLFGGLLKPREERTGSLRSGSRGSSTGTGAGSSWSEDTGNSTCQRKNGH